MSRVSVARVKELAAAGLSMAAVARELGVSWKVIRAVRWHHDIPFKRRYRRRTETEARAWIAERLARSCSTLSP